MEEKSNDIIIDKIKYLLHLSEKLSAEVGTNISDNIEIQDIPDSPVEIYLERCKGLDEYFNLLHKTAMIAPSCRQKCSGCCKFPLWTHEIEYNAIKEWINNNFSEDMKKKLYVTFQEWSKRIESLSINLMSKVPEIKYRYLLKNITCPFLSNYNCSIYNVRPIACRIYFSYGEAKNCNELLFPNETINHTCAYYNIYLTPAVNMVNKKFKDKSEQIRDILLLFQDENNYKVLPLWFLE